jgi:TPR repeat protein
MPIITISHLKREALSLFNTRNYLAGVLKLYEIWLLEDADAKAIFDGNHSFPTNYFQPEMLEAITKNAINKQDRFCLSLCYFAGIGVDKSYRLAENILISLVQETYAPGIFLLGWLYYKDRIRLETSLQNRKRHAVKLCQQAAEMNYAPAQVCIALLYRRGKWVGTDMTKEARYALAANLLKHAAKTSNVNALNCLGLMLGEAEIGLDNTLAQRNSLAFQLFSAGAQVGFGSALSNLACMYDNGQAGLNMSEENRNLRAISLYEDAIKTGNYISAWNLALLYKNKQNLKSALKFFSISASLSDVHSKGFQTSIDGIKAIKNNGQVILGTYALERALASHDKEMSEKCRALFAFTRPSDYLLFFDEDIKTFGIHDVYSTMLVEKLSFFANAILDLEEQERFSLVTLTLKIFHAYLQGEFKIGFTEDLIPIELRLEKLKPFLNALFVTPLLDYLMVYKKKIDADLRSIAKLMLCSLLLLDLSSQIDTILTCFRFITHLDESILFWQDEQIRDNIIRLLCGFFTNGHYMMMDMVTSHDLKTSDLKTLVERAMRKSIPMDIQEGSGFASAAPLDRYPRIAEVANVAEVIEVDELGLSFMGLYGISLIDVELVHRKIEELFNALLSRTPRPSIGFLGWPRAVSVSVPVPCSTDSLLHQVLVLKRTKLSHEILIGLLRLKNKLAQMPADTQDKLFLASKALVNATIDKRQSLEMGCEELALEPEAEPNIEPKTQLQLPVDKEDDTSGYHFWGWK